MRNIYGTKVHTSIKVTNHLTPNILEFDAATKHQNEPNQKDETSTFCITRTKKNACPRQQWRSQEVVIL